MLCPECGENAKCNDTRAKEGGWRWRRYKCKCGALIQTAEMVSYVKPKGQEYRKHGA